MGSGKGKQKRAKLTITSSTREIHPAERLTHTLNGNILTVNLGENKFVEEGTILFKSDNNLAWISSEYENKEKLSKKLHKLISQSHPTLLRNLKGIYLLGAYSPPVKNLNNPVACVEDENMFFWRIKENNNNPGLVPVIFNHELAHIAPLNDGSPPENIISMWEEAQLLDSEHTSRIISYMSGGQNTEAEIKVPGGPTIQLGNQYITEYASRSLENLKEDWADAVTTYIAWNNKEDRALIINNELLHFEDFYPNRSRLIKDFLDNN